MGPKPQTFLSFFPATNVIRLLLHHCGSIWWAMERCSCHIDSIPWPALSAHYRTVKDRFFPHVINKTRMFDVWKGRLWPHAVGCQKYWIAMPCILFLSQTSCGWLISWCMPRIFLRFKACSAYQSDYSPERATEWPQTAKVRVCPHKLNLPHSYVTERIRLFCSVKSLDSTCMRISE